MVARAYRAVVPQGYSVGKLLLAGTSPLLMNSGEVDRESDEYRAFANLGAKRGKSLDDQARLREMEWAFALYFDDKIGPYIPAKNVHELLRAAATKWKRGEDVKRSVIVIENRIPLEYKGPRTQQKLWDEGFRYQAMVANAGMNRGRVVRCRPCFDYWALTVDLAWDPEDVDTDTLRLIIERSQKFGLGDYRPTFGSFSATFLDGKTTDKAARVTAHKDQNAREARGHEASVNRLVA